MSSNEMEPEAGESNPAIIFRRVDFPTPLLPTTAHFSPADTEKLIFWKRISLLGCVYDKSWICRLIDICSYLLIHKKD